MLDQSTYHGRNRLRALKGEAANTGQAMQSERSRFDALDTEAAKPVAVSSFNLFPTPPEIAAELVRLSAVDNTHSVLEPSAGTGRLLEALPKVAHSEAVEINQQLANLLADKAGAVHCRDFLSCDPEDLGTFDRVIMNPPFQRGTDIKHIKHALEFVKPGGRLVALCANGPRQREQLKPMADYWEALPEGSFRSEGTAVSVAMLAIDRT